MTHAHTKRFATILMAILLCSCVSDGPITTSSNRRNLEKLDIGMSKTDVINTMGPPFQREVFPGTDGMPTEVLLYQTSFVGAANRPTDNDMTPVVLRNNTVLGWGRNFYDQTKHYDVKQEIDIK